MPRVKAKFLASATAPASFPRERKPEAAFAGRSNVGKSSLINGLLGDKDLARTSSTPGRTRMINFFDIEGGMRWVDLPGYGYAAVSKSMSAEWRSLIISYLLGREDLKLVLVLVDPRHGPTETDVQLLEWLRFHGKPHAVVLTKADKVKQRELGAARQRCAEVGVPGDRVFAYSIRQVRNNELWNFIRESVIAG